jgi:ribosome maturation factor RimP
VSASRGTHRPDPAAARLTALLDPIVVAAGYDLEELLVTPAGRRSVVRVVVDRDDGVTLDDIAEVSRAVSEALDQEDDGMGRTPYVLEVTSPGVDRPLSDPRHWRRNVGRLVTVSVGPAGSADEVTGRITAVDDDGVSLAVEAKSKPGAKKRPPTPREVPWAQLGAGRVQVEFGRGGPGDDTTHDTVDDPADDEDGDLDAAPEESTPARGGGL